MSRPTLRLIDGLREQADEAALELTVRLDEDRAFARRMRLALQRPLWSDPILADLRRPLIKELARFEAQIAAEPERVA